MLNVLLIGLGAIGTEILRQLQGSPEIHVSHVLTNAPEQLMAEHRKSLEQSAVVRSVAEIEQLPDFAIECAGAGAVHEQVVELLLRGVDVGICSAGALIDDCLTERIREAARKGGSQAFVLGGAIGGIDALSAGSLLGLDSVMLTSRKPPRGWLGTPAEQLCDLTALKQATIVFRGSAREAAALYPKNANSAATVALAGIGMDRTLVTLMADPTITVNAHEIEARGSFGEMNFYTANQPLAANPKTSALAALSALRAIRNRTAGIVV